MGQSLLNPPSVEGWQGGGEWINTGTVVERVNFASDMMGDTSNAGVQAIFARLRRDSEGVTPTAETLVDQCLDLIGPLPLPEETRQGIVDFAKEQGEVDLATPEGEASVAALLQMIVSTREYQLV